MFQPFTGVAVELVEDTALLKLVNETLQDLSTNQQSLEEWVD